MGSAIVGADIADEVLFVGRGSEAPDHPVLRAPVTRYANRLAGLPPAHTRLLLTVPDGSIPQVASEVARLGQAPAGCVAIHCSGALPARVLDPLSGRGYAIGSLHPLQTVADPAAGAEPLRQAFFAFEGEADARQAATQIVAAVAGRMLEVHAADKARYHAACVFASNYVVACASVATRLLAEAVGIQRDEAARALGPLWGGAVQNLDQLGLPWALTGPIARGDIETLRGHLVALEGDTRELYAQLALEALELSRQMGLDAALADAVEAELESSTTSSEKR